ncbi:hypothetical protein COLSTE_00069 [Collinsella stercoris DSM 13279]|uniref:Uncharacterized protein n=1 Tax=Collinsella stercoris DSM 13279 TaxID=445975 RepID=B6G7M9_9ACTN|nr:hypothetical protein COLSTE_00069 [Collinsella stercoris DSM 13279]
MCWAHAPHGARPDKDERKGAERRLSSDSGLSFCSLCVGCKPQIE